MKVNDFLWHIDSIFLDLVKKPLVIIAVVCGLLILAAAWLTAVTGREKDDA